MNQWKVAVATIVINVAGLAGAAWAAPFTRILEPASGQCVTGPNVVVKFEAGGVPMGTKAHNLHFKLDDEPFQVQFDGNHAHVFRNVPPGTHTVRVYFADSLHRAIPGSQTITTFDVAYGNGENRPASGTPLLTYNLPQGEYLGADAADITVDFLVENATLAPGGYQVAYYVDGRRFLVQNLCEQRTLKNLTPGPHRIRMELQDTNGDLLPGAFNSEERVIVVSPEETASATADVSGDYKGQPRIASIPGANTLGGPRPVTPHQLSSAQLTQQKSLTVSTAAGTVGIDGHSPAEGVPIAAIEKEVGTAGHSASAYSMIKEPKAEGAFIVRQGGLTEDDVADLDAEHPSPMAPLRSPASDAQQAVEEGVNVETEETPSTGDTSTSINTNIRRGSIPVHPHVEAKDPDEDEGNAEKHDDETTEKSDDSTTPTSRLRADGTRSAIHPTTGTLKLDKGVAPSAAEEKTSVTLHFENGETTASHENGQTTGPREHSERRGGVRGERGERTGRGERAPREDRSATSATEAAAESN